MPAVTYDAYGVVGLWTLLLLAMLSWGLHRVRVTAAAGLQTSVPEPRRPATLATPPAA
jgi:hypothetical protein